MNLWTAKASTSPELDRLEVRPLTPAEVASLRRNAQRTEDEGVFRCECLQCKLGRRYRGVP